MEKQAFDPGSSRVTTINLLLERIGKKSERLPNGCLIWIGAVSRSGYGLVGVDRKSRPVAQVVWEIEHQQAVPEGSRIAHTCGNKNCHELSHIALVNKAEHVRRTSPMIAEKSASPEARFRGKTTRDPDGHLLWTGDKTRNFTVDGRSKRASRFAWEQKNNACLLPDTRLVRCCEIENCIEPTHHRLVSRDHYLKSSPAVRARLGAVVERYWKKVGRGGPDQCWLWLGKVPPGHYASFAIQSGETVKAHRFGYETVFGRHIPEGFELTNLCGARSCQNPDHWRPQMRNTSVKHAGEVYRFTSAPRKAEEREAIREAFDTWSDVSPQVVAEQLNVSPGLVRKVHVEMVDSALIACGGRGEGKDGKSYARTRQPRTEASLQIRQDLLRDEKLSDRSLSNRHQVSTTLVKRIRTQMIQAGELQSIGFVVGTNGQRYALGRPQRCTESEVSELLAPADTCSAELEPLAAMGSQTCAWLTEKGQPCRNCPRRGYGYCRHHLQHRLLSVRDREQISRATETLDALMREVTRMLQVDLADQLPAERAGNFIQLAVSAVTDDYRNALVRLPELAAALSLENTPADLAPLLISGWAEDVTLRIRPGLHLTAGLTPPKDGSTNSSFTETVSFPADRIHLSTVVALCNAKHWTANGEFSLGREVKLGSRGFRSEVAFRGDENSLPWESIADGPEAALKLHYVLWARYFQQPTGWVRTTIEQLCGDLDYKRHRTGGFRAQHKRAIANLLGTLSHLYVSADLAKSGSPTQQPVSGPLWIIQLGLPAVTKGLAVVS